MVAPASKLSTLAWRPDTTLGGDLGVAAASTDQVYAAMDWLVSRQDAIEAGLGRPPPCAGGGPGADGLVRPVVLVAGGHALPARGYSHDGRKGTLQIEYGLLTDPQGRPLRGYAGLGAIDG